MAEENSANHCKMTEATESQQEQAVKKKPVGSFPVFLEKHIHQVKQKQKHWNDTKIEEFLIAQWQEMSDEQKACYVPENSDGLEHGGIGGTITEEAIKQFNTVLNTLIHKKYPIVGLDYISVQKIAMHDAEPLYRCGLCDITFSLSGVSSHVLGTRHKLGYLKMVNHKRFRQVVDMMKRKRTRKQDIIRLLIAETRKWESRYGRGRIKANKKDVPSITSFDRNGGNVKQRTKDNWNSYGQMMRNEGLLNPPYPEPSFQEFYPMDMPYPDPFPPDMPSFDFHSYKKMSSMQKLNLINELADSMISTETEALVANDILNAISKKMFQYRVMNLSPSETSALNKTLDTGDLAPLQNRKGQTSSKSNDRSGPSQNANRYGNKGVPLLPNPSSYSIRNIQSNQAGSTPAERDPFLIGGYSTEYKF